MKLYSYVVKHDDGFAPNPFWGYCTLACCKPKIRKSAQVGDWVVGTGAVKNTGRDKLIFAMKVTEKLTFAQYSKDNRFKNKIPSSGRNELLGDNIYYQDKDEKWIQRKALFHQTDKERGRDLSGKYVLVSDHYCYFGKKAIATPEEFKAVIKKGPNHKCNFDSNFVDSFIRWLSDKIGTKP